MTSLDTLAASSGGDPPPRFGGPRTILAVLSLTLVAVGAGAILGWTLGERTQPPAARSDEQPQATGENSHGRSQKSRDAEASARKPGERAPFQSLQIKELPPIVTNLAAPETKWVRLQAAIVYDLSVTPQPELLARELMSDIVAFLRTLTLASVEGVDGLRRLQEDLSERAAIRSEGRIREFIIQALVVQ